MSIFAGFENSFSEALPMGARAHNDYLANKRADAQLKMQQAAEARNQTEFDQKQDTYNKLQSLQKQLTNPNADNYSLGNSATEFAPGPAIDAPMNINDKLPEVPQLGLTTGVKLGGEGMKAQSGGEGMQPKQQLGLAPAKKLTANKTPERGAASNILAEMAILKGDTEGFARHKQAAADFDYEDGFNGHMKTALSADDKQRAALFDPLVGYLNDNNKQITMGDPDAKGFRDLAITTAGGKAMFARLSRQDQAKLYAAHMMMESNPTKAMAVMQSVNKDLAAAIAADNNLYGDLTKTNNDTAGKRHTAQHQDDKLAADINFDNGRLGIMRQQQKAAEKRADNESWEVIGTDPATGRPVLMNRHNGTQKFGDGNVILKGGRGAGTGDGKFHKDLEPGTTGVINGQRVKVLKDGSYGHPDASDDPMGTLTLNHPRLVQEFKDKISITPDGRGVFIGTAEDYERMGGRVTAFDYKNPKDLKELYNSLRSESEGSRLADESALKLQKSGGLSIPPRATRGQTRYNDKGEAFGTGIRASGVTPSIYDGGAAWGQYRQEKPASRPTPTPVVRQDAPQQLALNVPYRYSTVGASR